MWSEKFLKRQKCSFLSAKFNLSIQAELPQGWRCQRRDEGHCLWLCLDGGPPSPWATPRRRRWTRQSLRWWRGSWRVWRRWTRRSWCWHWTSSTASEVVFFWFPFLSTTFTFFLTISSQFDSYLFWNYLYCEQVNATTSSYMFTKIRQATATKKIRKRQGCQKKDSGGTMWVGCSVLWGSEWTNGW